jgi:hypothetical protein
MLALKLEACLKWRMLKSQAIQALGGTTSAAARAVGVTPQAVDNWPDDLTRRIEDRVIAALCRQQLPALREGGAGAALAKLADVLVPTV